MIEELAHRSARAKLDRFVILVDADCVAGGPVIHLASVDRLFPTVCVAHVD